MADLITMVETGMWLLEGIVIPMLVGLTLLIIAFIADVMFVRAVNRHDQQP